MPEVANAIFEIAEEYVDSGGERIYINDLSLPYGGLFDIEGNWQTPHSEHRLGNNADISGTGRNGRFLRERVMRERIIPNVSRRLRIYIDWPWHGDHYHFYFFPY
ncbi:MAG: hypothetical protein ABIN23_08090 [candidate division WOR-3 bacterium]